MMIYNDALAADRLYLYKPFWRKVKNDLTLHLIWFVSVQY
jgi:hypothetical protein